MVTSPLVLMIAIITLITTTSLAGISGCLEVVTRFPKWMSLGAVLGLPIRVSSNPSGNTLVQV
jgi:hypothetical protein